MSVPSVDDLWNNSKYSHLKTLRYQEIVEFVFENIRIKNSATRWYFVYNLLTLLILTGFAIYSNHTGDLPFKIILKYFFLGAIAGSFLIIPVHEIIHGLTYLLQGAPKIHFGADFKQMIFYVSSDKYVIGRNGFLGVALSPFTIINLIVIMLVFFSSSQWIIFLTSLLLFHNIMCIGDFAMVSFFLKNKDKELYTYDDHKEKTSYIFAKI